MNPFLVMFDSMLRLFWPAPAQPAPTAIRVSAADEPRTDAAAPVDAPAPAEPVGAAEPVLEAEPAETVEDQVDQEEPEEEDEDGAVLVDEPLPPDPEILAAQRHAAEAEALMGEHRVFPSTDAGPGTIAEALAKLEREGRVVCEFREDPEDGPYLLYKAVPPAAAAA